MKNISKLLNQEERLVLRQAKIWSQEFFTQAAKRGLISGGHGFDHNERVAGIAAVLSSLEGESIFLPVLTSLLFDVGRTSDDPRAKDYRHGEVSKELTESFINSLVILSPKDKIIVKNAIEDHPKKNQNVRESHVVKIVMDADRLDTLGPLGIVRSSAHRWMLPLFNNDIDISTQDSTIKTIYQDFAYRSPEFYDMLWTQSARRIAKPWVTYLKKFAREYKKQAIFMHKNFNNLNI